MFTEFGWKLVGSELLASSAIQERVNKLTVVLAKARLIANVVEFTCKVKWKVQTLILHCDPTFSH